MSSGTPSPPFVVRALYAYESDHPDDLTFQAGQKIIVQAIEDDEWYSGTCDGGESKSGMFPRNFVEYIPEVPSRPKRVSQIGTLSKQVQDMGIGPISSGDEQHQEQRESKGGDEGGQHEHKYGEVEESPVMQQEQRGQKLQPETEPAAGISQSSDAVAQPEPRLPAAGLQPKDELKEAEKPKPSQSSAFKDRIAAFNLQNAPLVPQKEQFNKNSSFVKKPYVPGPSSYVPPVPLSEPRPKPVEPEARAAAPIPADEEATNPVEEESIPKMSLKERIAMLQKQQQEERERMEAAALKKKKKKEVAVAGRKEQTTPPAAEGDEGNLERVLSGRSQPGEDFNETIGSPQEVGGEKLSEEEPEDASEDFVPEGEEISGGLPRPGHGAPREHDIGQGQGPEEEEDEEDEDEEEDEEEARRIALRERMAKISGGMGMNLGMLMTGGFPGATSTSSSKKTKKKDTPSVEEPEEERAAPVPIFPFATPSSLPRELQKHSEQEPEKEEGEELSPISGRIISPETSTAPPIPTSSGVPPPVPRRDSMESNPRHSVESSRASGEYIRRRSSDSQRRLSGEVRRSSTELLPEFQRKDSDVIRPADIGPIDEVIEDELGDDERTEPEEPITRAMKKRNSYIQGSGAVPPIPGAQMRKAATFDSSRSAAVVPPLPSTLSEEETTGYEADAETAIEGESLRRRVEERDHPSHAPPPPSAPPMAPPASSNRANRPPPPPPPVQVGFSQDESSSSFRDNEESDTEGGYVDYNNAEPPEGPHHPPPTPATPAPLPPAPPLGHAPPPPPQVTHAPPPPPPSSQAPPPLPPQIPVMTSPKSAPPPPPIGVPSLPPLSGHSPMQHSMASPPPALPPNPPSVSPPPRQISPRQSIPPQPPLPMRRTGSARDSVDLGVGGGVRRRQSTETSGSNTSGGGRPSGSFYAHDINLQLEDSDWWRQPRTVPPEIMSQSQDLLYEVEDSQQAKRGGRTLVNRDVYVVYPDYSQTTISVNYELHDPQGTVQAEQNHLPPPSEPRKDQLEHFSIQFGGHLLNAMSQTGNQHSLNPGDNISYIISQIKGALPAVGGRSFGVPIYQNIANSSMKQLDEIRPGDVVAIRNAKFQGHKGGLHQKYSIELGVGVPYVGVIHEWDGAKKKLRVIEQQGKKIKQESYKVQDLKSGEITVYRVADRGYVGWD